MSVAFSASSRPSRGAAPESFENAGMALSRESRQSAYRAPSRSVRLSLSGMYFPGRSRSSICIIESSDIRASAGFPFLKARSRESATSFLDASSFSSAECASVTVCTGVLTGMVTNTASEFPSSETKLASMPSVLMSGTVIDSDLAAPPLAGTLRSTASESRIFPLSP